MIRLLKRVRFAAAPAVLGALLLAFWAGRTLVARTADAATSPEAAAKTPADKASGGADEKAIRASADAFVKAFNQADAKAIGAMWAADAHYTDEHGVSFHGRAAIENEYAAMFKAIKGATMA